MSETFFFPQAFSSFTKVILFSQSTNWYLDGKLTHNLITLRLVSVAEFVNSVFSSVFVICTHSLGQSRRDVLG